MIAKGLLGDEVYQALEYAIRRFLAMRAFPRLLHTGLAHDIDKSNFDVILWTTYLYIYMTTKL